MGNPDFRAFEEYLSIGWDRGVSAMSIPRSVPGATSQYFILDLGKYHEGNNSAGTKKAMYAFVEEVFSRAEANAAKHGKTIPNTTGASPRETVDMVLTGSKNTPSFGEYGGGVAIPIGGFAVIDNRSSSLRDAIGDVMGRGGARTSAAEERYFDTYVRHHEAAHVMLDQHEASADFTAAVLTLREHPESRGMLRAMADVRLAGGIKYGAFNYDLYGAECHDAIEQALNISPERLRTMTPQDMHAIAAPFDRVNRSNGRNGYVSPEDRVHDSLMEVAFSDVKRGLGRIWSDVIGPQSVGNLKDYFVPHKMTAGRMAEALPEVKDSFPQGSVEDRMVDNLQESLGRLQQRTFGPHR